MGDFSIKLRKIPEKLDKNVENFVKIVFLTFSTG